MTSFTPDSDPDVTIEIDDTTKKWIRFTKNPNSKTLTGVYRHMINTNPNLPAQAKAQLLSRQIT